MKDNIISNYFAVFFPVFDEHNMYLAIRSYELNHEHHFLIVNPNTLRTYQKPSSKLKYRRPSNDQKDNGYIKLEELNRTSYYQALQKYGSPPYEDIGHGLKQAQTEVKGVFLTVDMCPSYKPLEKEFFEGLIKLARNQTKPIPVALAMTSLWMLEHSEEFRWLFSLKELDITWINHSLSHLYYPDIIKLQENFLNLSRTNLIQEILSPEQLLLSKGLTPSVFFRFPGLVASPKILKLINDFGLIPVSSNAWLAKGEKPTLGSIILVHGNSNEPKGIEIFMDSIQTNNFSFLPLSQALTLSSS